MRLLLVHQNFPGQFRQLAPYLQQQGHEVVAICSHERQTGINCRILRYSEPPKPANLSFGTALCDEAFQRARQVALLCEQLKQEGWRPDCICAHTGWGETLGLRRRFGLMCLNCFGLNCGCGLSTVVMAMTPPSPC